MRRIRECLCLAAMALIASAWSMSPARTQTAAPAANLIDKLMGSETPSDIDVPALRQKAADRVQAKADATALRRPPVAPELLKLPQVTFEVVFDPDSPVIRPQSYRTIGRIADALSDPKLRPYTFLVVDHTEATGRRNDNLTLSQRRADAIRAALVGTFKISSARLQALGLGEEQLQDPARPTAPANVRAQILTMGNVPDPVETQPAAGAASQKKKPKGSKERR